MASKTKKKGQIKAVLDTNIVVSALKSKEKKTSPNHKALEFWRAGKWEFLYCVDIFHEYVEKLYYKDIPEDELNDFIRDLTLVGTQVKIAFFHIRPYPKDQDDIIFFLCALNGSATHLVTNDKKHILPLRHFYSEFDICLINEFLEDL